MLPDKEKWTKEFVGSKRYKEVINTILDLPEIDFIPTWDVTKVSHDIHKRHWFYLIRVLPLQSFYILDYISKQTNGGQIVNLTEGFNFFSGMFNVVSWFEKGYGQSPSLSIHDLDYSSLVFDNTFCICGYYDVGFQRMEQLLNNIKKSTKNYGYIAFDSYKMTRNTNPHFTATHELNKYYKLNMFVDDMVEKLSKDVDIILYENIIQLEPEYPDSSTDPTEGDIRILFKTRPSTKA